MLALYQSSIWKPLHPDFFSFFFFLMWTIFEVLIEFFFSSFKNMERFTNLRVILAQGPC